MKYAQKDSQKVLHRIREQKQFIWKICFYERIEFTVRYNSLNTLALILENYFFIMTL